MFTTLNMKTGALLVLVGLIYAATFAEAFVRLTATNIFDEPTRNEINIKIPMPKTDFKKNPTVALKEYFEELEKLVAIAGRPRFGRSLTTYPDLSRSAKVKEDKDVRRWGKNV